MWLYKNFVITLENPQQKAGNKYEKMDIFLFRRKKKNGHLSVTVSDVSAPACTNCAWPHLRLVSVAQKNKPSTMLFLQCPIHRSSHGLHGLTVLGDETIEWLLNICHEI